MDETRIKELITKRQRDKRISCRTAMEIADETGASKLEIGRILNEMEIKIHSCQLGCFK